MNKNRSLFTCALALFAQQANSAIVKDGLWTGNDWYATDKKMGVENGIPYSDDELIHHTIRAPLSLDSSIDSYLDMKNVQLVQSIFPASQWPVAFPHANSVYTYDDFLKAVGKFPTFCNDNNISGNTLEQTCKRELSTIFAHWGQETGKRDPNVGEFWTQGLYYVEEIAKNDYKDYGWSGTAWPNQAGVQYYGRGPMQLSWNYNYGQFSNIFSTTGYDSKMELLRDPGAVSRDGYTAMSAGLWFYMFPQNPKPSMHDVMTGWFTPNSIDLSSNITNSFATTINIINGGLECGKGFGFDKVVKRGEYFLEWLNFFGLPAESDLDCGNQPNLFPAGGFGSVSMYYDKDWNKTACKIVNWQTLYSAAARDDYKRCVCDLWGNGASDCLKGEDDTSNQETGGSPTPTPDPEPTPTPDPTPTPTPEPEDETDPEPTPPAPVDPDVWKTWATLQEIRDTPHYSSTSYSRTLYQVDRELDFIEDKIVELFQVAVDNNLF